jgi:hypothetical protein
VWESSLIRLYLLICISNIGNRMLALLAGRAHLPADMTQATNITASGSGGADGNRPGQAVAGTLLSVFLIAAVVVNGLRLLRSTQLEEVRGLHRRTR